VATPNSLNKLYRWRDLPPYVGLRKTAIEELIKAIRDLLATGVAQARSSCDPSAAMPTRARPTSPSDAASPQSLPIKSACPASAATSNDGAHTAAKRIAATKTRRIMCTDRCRPLRADSRPNQSPVSHRD